MSVSRATGFSDTADKSSKLSKVRAACAAAANVICTVTAVTYMACFWMQVFQLSGFSDPVYVEAYVNVHQYDILLDGTCALGCRALARGVFLGDNATLTCFACL